MLHRLVEPDAGIETLRNDVKESVIGKILTVRLERHQASFASAGSMLAPALVAWHETTEREIAAARGLSGPQRRGPLLHRICNGKNRSR